MSNKFKIKPKKASRKPNKVKREVRVKHTSFNIFTKNGKSLCDVKTPHPMTLEDAQVYFDALCIGAND